MSPSAEPMPVQNFDALLSQSLGNDFQIKHLEWKPLTAPGENYGSVMVAITVTLSRGGKMETLNLVSKLPPTTAYLLDLFNSPVTFKKELCFYNSMAQEFINLQLESGINEKDLSVLVPKFLGGRMGLKNPEEFDEQAAIVLENLKYSGYDTEDRIFGLDRKHTEYAIDELAKLHALAIALKFKKPKVYAEIANEVLADVLNDLTEKCVLDMITKSQADMMDIKEIEPYMERVNRTIEYGIEACKNMEKPEEPWGTLVHNDFWVNNMMFQHDEQGKVKGLKIVDFQLGVYDYGVKDLIFFLVSSANKEILDNHLEEMIDLYYSCFINFLRTLKVDTKKFSKQRFDEIVNTCGPIKFNQCIMMAQVIQAPRGSVPEMKDLEGNVFATRPADDVYKQKLIDIVRLFDRKGWLLK